MATNISKIYLLKVPLENDYKNTLYFANANAQYTYFYSKVVKSYTDFTYQRKDHIIRIPEEYDTIYNVNYVMYQNSAYSNKWFYAFIKDLRYVNDGMTEATIETDVIQTWMFDYTVKSSFVEREHVSNDGIGVNTVPEGLETGEYICNSHTTDSNMVNLLNDCRYVLALTENYEKIVDPTLVKYPGGRYNGIYSGAKYYGLDSSSEIGIWLDTIDSSGKGDTIVGLFIAPKWLSTRVTNKWDIAESNTPVTYTCTQNKITTINGYSPRNNKLFTYPYVYMHASNNQGSDAIYHYEKFSTTNCQFSIQGALTPGCSIRMVPLNYNGVTTNDSEGFNLGKFPICSWTNDMYTNWLTQNSVNIATNFITSGATTIGGVALMASGGGSLIGAGMIGSGLLGITKSVGELHEHSLIPRQASGNLNAGDVISANGTNTFHFYQMSIKQEYARIVDGFFDMFGYKVNAVKIPNTNHRARWWYTKTIDVSIDGDIPDDDMQKIKDCYNNGIRFWKNASEIENYSLSNGIV